MTGFLPVGPVPAREDSTEREARTAALQLFGAVAVGGALWKAAHDTQLRWSWVNLPVVMSVGLLGAVVGIGVARLVEALTYRVKLPFSRGSALFWSRYIAVFAADTIGFEFASSRLEDVSLWRGSSQWAWVMGWPLATLMIDVVEQLDALPRELGYIRIESQAGVSEEVFALTVAGVSRS